jgi:hypothetical protein
VLEKCNFSCLYFAIKLSSSKKCSVFNCWSVPYCISHLKGLSWGNNFCVPFNTLPLWYCSLRYFSPWSWSKRNNRSFSLGTSVAVGYVFGPPGSGWIRYSEVRIWLWILLSSSKNSKINLSFKISFLLVSWRSRMKMPDSDPLVRGTSPQIHMKMSQINNTAWH